ncbi:GTP-binding domain [Pseudomonas phage UF_RH7]|nr:GTP-binding domain [Pseudomonas phage UF_RH7]
MIIAATGHRPEKLGGYSAESREKLREFAVDCLQSMGKVHPIEKVISGMALGWDTAVAEACVLLKIPFIAAVPFIGQEAMWNNGDQVGYRQLLQVAAQTVVVSRGAYAPGKMSIRNQWMVDHCGMLLALHNGSKGGTSNCVDYAMKQGVSIVNCWGAWQDFSTGAKS